MLRDADTAMHRAKAAGRGGCVVFDQAMHYRAVERLQLESELRQAIVREEFFLHYQPIVSLPSKYIVGFEALLRWQSPRRGLVEPKIIIPVAEETGLIVPIGAWVLREACIQLRSWQERFVRGGLTMSVNLSAKQFLQPDLVSTVARILRETGVAGHSLCLELTESAAMEDPERTYSTLEELQHLGVRLSLDDFGTGYSSLDQLHRFSVDTLKVDRYFVAGMTTNERNQKIVKTIINLAHNLGIGVIAEGAETAEHVDLLNGMACDCLQGYVYSKPLEPKGAESLLASPLGPSQAPDPTATPQPNILKSTEVPEVEIRLNLPEHLNNRDLAANGTARGGARLPTTSSNHPID
jgi:EAL domain-containing protein (putative c-di-GMP-specific phosphodiesterase class I)